MIVKRIKLIKLLVMGSFINLMLLPNVINGYFVYAKRNSTS